MKEIRNAEEIKKAEERFFREAWYTIAKETNHERAQAKINEIADDYECFLGPHTDYKLGMIHGKLSALRWVLGMDWDSLDT